MYYEEKVIDGVLCCRTSPHGEWKAAPKLASEVAALLEAAPAIPPDWTPTSENINALPEPVRLYIAAIETQCDPAGMVRENVQLKDTLAALQLMYRKAAEAAPAAQTDAESANEDAPCPTCDGSGEVTVLSDNGPDAYEMPEQCPHCNGKGTLIAAFRGGLQLAERNYSQYIEACGVIAWRGRERQANIPVAQLRHVADQLDPLTGDAPARLQWGRERMRFLADAIESAPSPAVQPAAPTVAEATELLVSALSESKGWLRNYSRVVIEDAIARTEPGTAWLKEAERLAMDFAHCYSFVGDDTMPKAKAAFLDHLRTAAPGAEPNTAPISGSTSAGRPRAEAVHGRYRRGLAAPDAL